MPTLEVTTVASCTVRCTFCPQDALKAAYPKDTAHRLSLAAFRTVLGKLPPYVRVDFSGFVEPWLNPDCTEMLRETLERGYSVGIYTTLQGMRDPQKVTGLLIAYAPQIEVFCLHLPDANGNMTGHRDDEQWRTALRCFMALRSSRDLQRFEMMTMDSGGRLAQLVPVERLRPWTGNDRAGVLERAAVGAQHVEAPVAHQEPVGCSFTPFYDQNVMLPNGDVVLCCMDYSLSVPLGNLLRQEYHELFSGPAMGRLRAANMQTGVRYDEAGRTICKRCTRATRYRAAAGARQTWVETT